MAALIVSESGRTDVVHGGLRLKPKVVEAILRESAVDTPCPEQNPFDYPDLPEAFTAFCAGNADFNGFYGDGIVNALNAVQPGGA